MTLQQHPSGQPSQPDLEVTAELPVLDVAGSEARDGLASSDTWAVPAFVQTKSDGELEGELRTLAENLRDVEERLRVKSARLIELEREIEEFQEERRAWSLRIRELEARGAESELVLRESRDRDRLLAELRRELAEEHARAVGHLEVLQTLEARRGIWNVLFEGLDQQIDEREARVANVEKELAQRTAEVSELRSELAARTAWAETLAHDVTGLGAALASERAELERSNQTQTAQIAAQAATIGTLKKDLQEALARSQDFESDLRAAEDSILRLEAEVRGKSARLEELAKASEEWRREADAARRSVEERDTRISHLEADVASSAALVGNIKQSLERLEPVAAVEPPPQGATRLLVRTDGESEIVHVLGRKTTLGRTPDNDLQIDARFISRHHAVILAGPIHTIIEDLNSTNGVRVNSRRVSRQTLKDGDIVTIGKTRFRFAVRQPGR